MNSPNCTRHLQIVQYTAPTLNIQNNGLDNTAYRMRGLRLGQFVTRQQHSVEVCGKGFLIPNSRPHCRPHSRPELNHIHSHSHGISIGKMGTKIPIHDADTSRLHRLRESTGNSNNDCRRAGHSAIRLDLRVAEARRTTDGRTKTGSVFR